MLSSEFWRNGGADAVVAWATLLAMVGVLVILIRRARRRSAGIAAPSEDILLLKAALERFFWLAYNKPRGRWLRLYNDSQSRVTLLANSTLLVEHIPNLTRWPPQPGDIIRVTSVLVDPMADKLPLWHSNVVVDAEGIVPVAYDETAGEVPNALYLGELQLVTLVKWTERMHDAPYEN